MPAQPKKPRQRNRPKNKANREATTPPKSIGIELEALNLQNDVGETKIAEISKPATFEQQQLQQQEQHESSHGSNSNITTTSSSSLVTESLYQCNDAMKFLQAQMRSKFSKLTAVEATTRTAIDLNLTAAGEQGIVEECCEKVASTTKLAKKLPKPIKKENFAATNAENLNEKNAFIANLQKQMETVMAKGNTDLPQTLLGNLQKLLDQEPISDVESSDDEAEYIEYVYKPRQYFLATLCNFCKTDLLKEQAKFLPCKRCNLTYYCSAEHMKLDAQHRELCNGLKKIAVECGGHIFYKCGDFSADQFRSYRIVTIRSVESLINRSLTAEEQEIILFPRICAEARCRENDFKKLKDCQQCGQLAYCANNEKHFPATHQRWCRAFQLFKELIIFQTKFGRLEPSLPNKILKDIPGAAGNTRQLLHKLNFDVSDACEYAALSQIATAPLSAWYALKLCGQLKKPNGILTIHLIGAEIEFEVDLLHKWELFFLHITPAIKTLNVVFIGPELDSKKIAFDQLKKTKCCRSCRKLGRTVNYDFECKLYHNFCDAEAFTKPDLICFFNAGLYRATGYQLEDTWPDTILAAANIKCPIIVTSYTEYEAPLDMTRFVQEANRHLNVVLPPIMNPFASEKPERNFVSDDEAPLIFKNFYCFIIE